MPLDSYQMGNVGIDMNLVLQIGKALAILLGTWLLANMAKWAAAKLVDNIEFLQSKDGSGNSIGLSIGKIFSLLVWLFGLIAILNVMNLTEVIAPLQNMLNQITGYLPNLLAAGLIFFFGLIIARIARQILETALEAVNIDKWLSRAKADEITGSNKVGAALARIAFAFIMVLVAIAALNQLRIEAISGPAVSILESIAGAIPLIFGASILLGIFFVVSRWVGDLVKDIMANLGADQAIDAIGILPKSMTASSVAANLVKTIIMLFGAIAATRMLAFPELTVILNQILELGGRVIFGSIVIGAGILLANFITNIVSSSTGEKSVVTMMMRYLIIAVATFMGLTFMEIGEQIVIIAFSGFVFATSVAVAIAFGMGGRDAAARQLKKWQDKNNG